MCLYPPGGGCGQKQPSSPKIRAYTGCEITTTKPSTSPFPSYLSINHPSRKSHRLPEPYLRMSEHLSETQAAREKAERETREKFEREAKEKMERERLERLENDLKELKERGTSTITPRPAQTLSYENYIGREYMDNDTYQQVQTAKHRRRDSIISEIDFIQNLGKKFLTPAPTSSSSTKIEEKKDDEALQGLRTELGKLKTEFQEQKFSAELGKARAAGIKEGEEKVRKELAWVKDVEVHRRRRHRSRSRSQSRSRSRSRSRERYRSLEREVGRKERERERYWERERGGGDHLSLNAMARLPGRWNFEISSPGYHHGNNNYHNNNRVQPPQPLIVAPQPIQQFQPVIVAPLPIQQIQFPASPGSPDPAPNPHHDDSRSCFNRKDRDVLFQGMSDVRRLGERIGRLEDREINIRDRGFDGDLGWRVGRVEERLRWNEMERARDREREREIDREFIMRKALGGGFGGGSDGRLGMGMGLGDRWDGQGPGRFLF